jgi:PPOX class probable F420-dependent enzyme
MVGQGRRSGPETGGSRGRRAAGDSYASTSTVSNHAPIGNYLRDVMAAPQQLAERAASLEAAARHYAGRAVPLVEMEYGQLLDSDPGGRRRPGVASVPVRKGLAVADLGDLVDLPLLAVLATYRADGTALLSPVWHEYRDGGFNVCTSEGDIKARHLRRDPRAGLVVAEPVPPYRGVEVTTEATFVRDGVEATVERVAIKYLGEAKGRQYAQSAPDDIVVRLEPGRLRAWDFSDTPI